MTNFMAIVGLACVIWAIVAGLEALKYCQARGVSVNPLILGIEMLRGLSHYRKLTLVETGHIGPLFYHYVIPINIALLIVIVLLASRLI